ncbi:MAG: glycosyltransferase family 4 protein [bacterium]
MWLRLAAKRGSAMWVDVLAGDTPADPAAWVRERVDALCADGARGPLYVFIREPPDAALAAILGWVATDRRLEPTVIAASSALASRADIERVQPCGAHTLYVTLDAADAASSAAGAGELERWRPALRVLAAAPALMPRVRVGVQLMLTPASVRDLPRALQLSRRLGKTELLLWDGGCPDMDAAGLAPAEALRALEFAIATAEKLDVRLRPVGFERTRAAQPAATGQPALASRMVVELLRDGIPLPSSRHGLLAADGTALAQSAATGRGVVQLAFELAAAGSPLLDLPACLGGPPPTHAQAPSHGAKREACASCVVDAQCAGVATPLLDIAGLAADVRPLPHWSPLAAAPRVLVLCPVVTDVLYGATFFSLARQLAQRGARVDLVSPWALHADIDAAFSERQPLDRPQGASAVEQFVADGAVDAYDLIVTPDLHSAHALIVGRRLRPETRLAATDFHMLWGMDDWVRDLCPAGRRPEEGGWWPSEQVVIYSAFPGYARLYTRYGVPLRQVVWQPYGLDPAAFPAALPPGDGEAIISAGRHLRDLDTLLRAAAALPAAVHPIDLFAEAELAHVPPHIRFRGTVPSAVFCPEVGHSRFMLVPLQEDPHKAAGITAMATAILCGRPLVASATAAARDYVVDGVNGLLVPPGDCDALRDAIVRLDTDAALLAQLAAGARAAALQLGTAGWAERLLHGSRTHAIDAWTWDHWHRRRA